MILQYCTVVVVCQIIAVSLLSLRLLSCTFDFLDDHPGLLAPPWSVNAGQGGCVSYKLQPQLAVPAPQNQGIQRLIPSNPVKMTSLMVRNFSALKNQGDTRMWSQSLGSYEVAQEKSWVLRSCLWVDCVREGRSMGWSVFISLLCSAYSLWLLYSPHVTSDVLLAEIW